MTAPARRIQRRRTAGWRMPTGTVYVGRPTRWGNPYTADPTDPAGRVKAVNRYRLWITTRPDLIAAARAVLAGRDLACWCPLGAPCHADVLLTLANTNPADQADPRTTTTKG
ncbi:DUF4326 domain-containing protein [Solwaraspora sp. WMMB762]|uniref:DUF4326 domain-containing protein n=1 Tax=Solwaraspora sp. WMMB762 TaxID=3404120 RepID=UPI003B933058